MPARTWLADLRSRLGVGVGPRDVGLGILAFEAAATMSRLVSLHRTVSDAEVRRLRADVLRAEGVARLTSADQALLLRLACGELLADLDRAADGVARLGARSGDAPLLRDFDRVYAEAKRGRLAQLDATVGFSRGGTKRFREMERHALVAARLYAEMDALSELEASEQRMEQWKQHSGPIPAAQTGTGKRPAAEPEEKLMSKLRAQRQKVRRLMEGSLWNVAAGKAARLMAKSVLAVLARISLAFGASVPGLPAWTVERAWALGRSSGPLHPSATPAALRHSAPIFGQKDAASPLLESTRPSVSTVGGSSMELRYANVILAAETLLAALRPPAAGDREEEAREGMIDLSKRDALYKMLPVSIREAMNAKLRGSWKGQPVDEVAAAASRDAAERLLRWLSPMAHDTVRWNDERSMERAKRFSMLPRAFMVQTLHFADRQKADSAIVDVLVSLSCVCWYDDERRRLESHDWDDE